jgi:transcriptional regulator with XRE-family HTH domain
MKSTGEILKDLMDSHGHNAYDLEELSGVPQPTIHRILKGEHGEPRKKTLDRLAAVYGLQAAHLRGEIPIHATVETADYTTNAHAIVPASSIKKTLMEFINAIDDKKLSPKIIPVIREIIASDPDQAETMCRVVYAVRQPNAKYHENDNHENDTKREANGE